MKIQLTSDWLRNLIRTVVPTAVGVAIAHYLARVFPGLSLLWVKAHTAGLYGVLTTTAVGVYYGAFRWLETKVQWASAFLGAHPVGFVPAPPKAIVAKVKLETHAPEQLIVEEGAVPAVTE